MKFWESNQNHIKMKLLVSDKDVIQLDPHLHDVKEFADILKKKNSQEILSYIYHMYSWDSPYSQHYVDREEIVNAAYPNIKVDKVTQKAIDKYIELQTTDAIKLLQSARKAVSTLHDYFENFDPTTEEDSGKAVKDLINNIKAMGGLIQGIKDLQEEVKKEQQTDKQIRKGVEINQFNE